MENFIVSARKYRPSTFNTVVGQGAITVTLKNAIKNNHLAHAYLFCGPRGVGKTSCARIFAKTINCSQMTPEFEACNQCESCQAFNENRSYNIHELDAASNNSVEDIRTLIDQVRIPPQIGKYSIYIIDEVHMLSAAAFNAFLKTLEEPPEHAIFILATTEKHKIIPTILSRCQIFDFNRIKVPDAVEHLKFIAKEESVQIEEEGLNVIAMKADGAMRDALSIFDQIVSFSGKEISYQNVIENLNVLDYDYYFRMVDGFIEGKVSEVLLLFNEIIEKGFDGHHFISGLSAHLRDVLVGRDPVTLQLLEVGDSIKKKYLEQAQKCQQDFLYDALQILSQCDVGYKASQNKRLFVELTLIQLSQIIESKKKGASLTKAGSKKLLKIFTPEQTSIASAPANGRSTVSAAGGQNIATSAGNARTQVANVTSNGRPASSPSVSGGHRKTISIMDSLNQGYSRPTSSASTRVQTTSSSSSRMADMAEVFSERDIMGSLKEFLKVKDSNERVRSALTAHEPLLKENHHIVIRVDNSIQEDDVRKKKSEILNFLKRSLRNTRIDIDTEIVQTRSGKKLYTDFDRFEYLAKKNPVLNVLKQKFSLDFD
ncbi:MAG: DNA polymerase III subunit gamma/tau [Marinifilaceae bacterium]